MSLDIEAIKRRQGELMRHYHGGDEGEFSLAAAEALDDVPALLDEVEALRVEVARAHARANEAARLSANARDDAEALNGIIAELREQVGIVEGDRTTTDAWAVNLAYEHHAGYRLDTASVDPYVAITECLADRATLREFADKAVAGREFYARQVDRLALVRVWTNEDGKGFMFIDDVRAALCEETP